MNLVVVGYLASLYERHICRLFTCWQPAPPFCQQKKGARTSIMIPSLSRDDRFCLISKNFAAFVYHHRIHCFRYRSHCLLDLPSFNQRSPLGSSRDLTADIRFLFGRDGENHAAESHLGTCSTDILSPLQQADELTGPVSTNPQHQSDKMSVFESTSDCLTPPSSQSTFSTPGYQELK